MNTVNSDAFVQEWKSKSNLYKRAAFTAQRTFKTTTDKLFALICPTTELDWLLGFSCELMHSESGYAEYDAVFQTEFFGPKELWVCTRYEKNKAIDYARTADDYCAKLDVIIVDNFDGTVNGTWTMSMSAVTEKGNQAVEQLKKYGAEGFAKSLDDVNYYLVNGEIQMEKI